MFLFKLHSNNDSGIIYLSQKTFNFGDFDLKFFIRVMHTAEWDREWAEQGQYHVSLGAVSPQAAKDTDTHATYGMSKADYDALPEDGKAEMLIEAGVVATFDQWQGNNLNKLLKEARKVAIIAETFFGFYMDKHQNKIGATGWEFIRGEYNPKKQQA